MNYFEKSPKKLKEVDILKKLENSDTTSPQEYEAIIQSLEEQNERLKSDHNDLQIRVRLLKQKQKEIISQQFDPKTDYGRIRKQLDRRYRQFGKWQKKSFKSENKSAINVHCRSYLDQLKEIQSKMTIMRKQYIDQKKAFKKLQKSIKDELKFMNKNLPQRQELEEENKELRRLIWNMKVVDDLRTHVEVRIQDKIIKNQQKSRIKERMKTVTVDDVKNEDYMSKLDVLKKEKDKRGQRMKTMVDLKPQEIDRLKKKDKIKEMKEQSAILQSQYSQMQLLKRECIDESKRLQSIYEEQEKRKEQLNKSEVIIQMTDISLQVNQYEDEDMLRKQSIGIQSPYLIDDRYILKTNKHTLIVGLIYYESKYGLGFIKALYSNGKQTQQNFHRNTKTKNTKIILKNNDHLKWIKAFHSKRENRICRIEFYSHQKQKYQIGQTKQELMSDTLAYKFDNLPTEVPVCLSCSYRPQGTGQWVLTSFAVQINNQ